MIDAYTWTTPNGQKLLIALEELGLPYQLHWVDIAKGEQHRPEYLAINPNHKIPAIVDSDGPDGVPITVFESGAVLLYLADKAQRLIPATGAARYQVMEWLFFQAGGTGPMIGQLGYFKKYAPEKIPAAIERYTKETQRLFGVLDRHLATVPYLATTYSVADLMNITWVHAGDGLGVAIEDYEHLRRWHDDVMARPGVQRGFALQPT